MLGLRDADPRQFGDGEDRGGGASVVGGLGGSVDHVRCGHLALEYLDWSERHAGGVGGVACCVYGWIGRALQVAGDRYAFAAVGDAGRVQVEWGRLGHSARSVDDQIGLDDRLGAGRVESNAVGAPGGPDRRDGCLASHFDADIGPS